MASVTRKYRWPLFLIVGLVLLALIAGLYLIFRGDPEEPAAQAPAAPLKRMANLPAPKAEPKPELDYSVNAPLLERVRKALREGISPEEAANMADSLPDEPERADAAFLLLDYAAESGVARAALALGRYYDPTDDSPIGSIQKDPAFAYEYYQNALDGGEKDAALLLTRLRQWAEKEAARGSGEARALLRSWP